MDKRNGTEIKMINFNNFPVKELLLRVLAITVVVFSFLIASTFIDKRQIVKKSLTGSTITLKNTKQDNLSCNKQQEKILALVDKLNAHIEEQAFLLTQANRDKSKLSQLIPLIKKRLNVIEQKAFKNKIENLIDTPQIDQIKKDLKTYQQSLITKA